MTTTEIGPVGKADRIALLDILRGVAVCGILLMNIPLMGMLFENPRPALPSAPNADWIAFTVQSLVFEGTMRGLFTLLFGAGMMIMLKPDDGDRPAAMNAYLTRCFALMLLGVANFALFAWPGEILTNYGIAGLFVVLFRKAPVRLLLTAAVALLILMSINFGVQSLDQAGKMREGIAAAAAKADGKKLDEAQTKALAMREEMLKSRSPTPEMHAREREERTHLPSLLKWSAKRWVEFNLSPQALGFLPESIAFMLIGVALFRMGVLTGERSWRVYALMAVAGYGLGLLNRGAILALRWQAGFAPNPDLWGWAGFTYEADRLPMTIGLVGLLVLLWKIGALNWIASALQALGRLALTNYVGQSIITSVLFYGFGLFDKLGFAALMGVAAAIWVVQAIFSLLWLRVWDMGPAEWLLRSLTYGTRAPLPRAAKAEPEVGR